MKHFDKHLVCAIALICSSSAFAAETANIAISGEVSPAACALSASKAQLDFGKVKSDDKGIPSISSDLGSLNITCANQTLVNIKFSSSAPGSVNNPKRLAGWFNADGTAVADSLITLEPDFPNVTLNGSSGGLIEKAAGGTWGKSNNFTLGDNQYSLAPSSLNSAPSAIQSAIIPLKVTNSDVAAGSLNWTKGPITANQTLTFELVYP